MPRLQIAAVALTCAVLCSAVAPRAVLADTAVVVQSGDNLFRIALRNGTTVDALMRANGLYSPDRIYAGQRLVIPGANAAGSGSAGGAGRTGGVVSGGRHVVLPGETLSRIAQRYGTTVNTLIGTNGLVSADRIFAGQTLIVPGAGTAAGGPAVAAQPAGGGPGRRIVVDLSSQTLTAYQNGTAAQSFVVSTGKPGTATPLGTYGIYARYAAQTMYGPGYYLPGVPYVQYFTGAYAIHGTYWHASFGVPVSHGCVNLRPADAAWLWRWAAIGTQVTVQP